MRTGKILLVSIFMYLLLQPLHVELSLFYGILRVMGNEKPLKREITFYVCIKLEFCSAAQELNIIKPREG